MKAIRIEEYGGPETLRLGTLELPDPGPGEVHVKLRAAGLNFVDVNLRRGEVRTAGPNFVDVYPSRGEDPSSLPFTPGFDGAGIIDAVGEGVKEFKPGDRVAYTGHLGTYAEASVVPASKLIPLPDDLSFEQGAAFPHQGMTAHYLIHEYHLPKPGATVLIHAAAGGVHGSAGDRIVERAVDGEVRPLVRRLQTGLIEADGRRERRAADGGHDDLAAAHGPGICRRAGARRLRGGRLRPAARRRSAPPPRHRAHLGRHALHRRRRHLRRHRPLGRARGALGVSGTAPLKTAARRAGRRRNTGN